MNMTTEQRAAQAEAVAGEAIAMASIALLVAERLIATVASKEPLPASFIDDLEQEIQPRIAGTRNPSSALVAASMQRFLKTVLDHARAGFKPKN